MSVFDITDNGLDWRADAACLEHDPETFFPEQGPEMGATLSAARTICAGCPVRAECLEDSLAAGDMHGIRAGLGMRQRQKIIRERGGRPTEPRQPTHGTPSGYRYHYRLGTTPCEPCKAAEKLRKAEHRERGAA